MLILGLDISNQDSLTDITINEQLLLQFLSFISTVIVIFIFRKYVDKKSIKSLGFSFSNRAIDLISGFIIATLLIGGGTLILYSFGYIDFENYNFNFNELLFSFILFIFVAFNEEVLVRGYILGNIMTSLNKFLALIISAIIFALIHGMNPNLSLIAMLNLFIAGLLLGSAYIFTKNLWFPISLHLFWNFLQGPIFGYSVSGNNMDSLLTIKTIGNTTINGGEFGFEGSILCTIICVISIASIMIYYNRKTAVEK